MRWSLLRASRILVPVCSILFATAAPAAAETRAVCAAGCTYTTIQSALDAALAGDVIQVAAGTYPEAIEIDTAVSIVGAKAGVDARTRTTDEGETIITGGGSLAVDAMAPLTLDGVTIDSGSAQALYSDDTLVVSNSKLRGGATNIDVAVIDGSDTATFNRSIISRPTGSGSAVLFDSVGVGSVTNSALVAPTLGTTYGIEVVGAGGTVTATGNLVKDFDRGLYVRGTFAAAPVFRLNRVDRASTSSDGVYSSSTTTTVDATDNLWGCGTTVPQATGSCDVTGGSGAITTSPYLVVRVAAATSPVPASVTTAITATIGRHDGSAIPEGSAAFDGTLVDWTTSEGTLAGANSTMATGVASVGFVPAAAGGTARVKATVDGHGYESAIETRGVPATATSAARMVGLPRFAQALTCETSWSRTGTSSYAWLRNGVEISGAVARIYTVGAADIGAQLSCRETITPANTDPTASTSAAAKVLKRRVVLAVLQSNARGVSLTCGTARKPCVHRVPAAMYLKVTPHATHFTGMKLQVVLERKSGRRWIASKPVVLTVGTKPLVVPTRTAVRGAYRVRVLQPKTKVDDAVASAYRFVTLR